MSNVVSTTSNLIVPVPRKTVQAWIARLNRYIVSANSVSLQSNFSEIRRSEVSLHKARELFAVLWESRAISNWQEVEEDMNRIETKLATIRAEKSRCYRLEKRRV